MVVLVVKFLGNLFSSFSYRKQKEVLQERKPITEDKSIPDIGKKIKFVSSASKVYGKLMHGLGMGIYSVIGAVKEK